LENLTHSLVGLFLARMGFKYATPRGTAILILAANAPDVDTVVWFGGPAAYIEWHRHITHSLIAIPFVALLSVALVRLIGRRPVRWLRAWLIAVLAVVSHIVLDLTNVYGVRLLLPSSGQWFHWDITLVWGLAIWSILFLGLAAPALARLVGSEIGEQRRGAGNAGWAVTAILLLSAYEFGRSVFHDKAAAIVESNHYNGLAPRRAGAFPSANPLVWTGMVELSNAYVQIPVDLRANFHVSDGETFFKPERTPAVEAAMRSEPFQRFLAFVQYPLWVTEPSAETEGGTLVRLLDLRFGNPRAIGFAATATVDARGAVLNSRFGFGEVRPR